MIDSNEICYQICVLFLYETIVDTILPLNVIFYYKWKIEKMKNWKNEK